MLCIEEIPLLTSLSPWYFAFYLSDSILIDEFSFCTTMLPLRRLELHQLSRDKFENWRNSIPGRLLPLSILWWASEELAALLFLHMNASFAIRFVGEESSTVPLLFPFRCIDSGQKALRTGNRQFLTTLQRTNHSCKGQFLRTLRRERASTGRRHTRIQK
jgi:hypothetical protein